MVNTSARAVAPVLAALLLAPPGRAATNGFKLGDGKLHVGLELESRFDSTAGFRDGAFRPDLIIKIRPNAQLEVPSPAVAVKANAIFEWNQYLGFSLGRLDYAGGQGELGLTFARDAPFTVEVTDRFTRSDRTTTLAFQVGAMSNYNVARLRALFRPGKGAGGGALEVGGWYENQLEVFQQRVEGTNFPGTCSSGDPLCDPRSVTAASYMTNRGGLEGRLRFLPRTAVVADVNFGNRFYFTATGNTTANPLRGQVGLAGLITPKVSAVIKAGWGHSLAFEASGLAEKNFNSVIGQIEFAYAFSETFNARAGFVRDFQPMPGALSFNEEDRIYADLGLILFGKLAVFGTANFSLLPFGRKAGAAGGAERVDQLFDFHAGVDYELLPWAHLGGGASFQFRASDPATTAQAGTTAFTRFEVFGRASVQY